MKLKTIVKSLLVIVLLVAAAVYSLNAAFVATVDKPVAESPRYYDGVFHNDFTFESFSWEKLYAAVKRQQTEVVVDDKPSKTLPMIPVTRESLDAIADDELRIVKLGHSSILIKAYGKYLLIDPMFSDRASPFGFFGPERFQPTPIALDDLPPIDTILVSHNHYDHLDKASIKALIAKTEHFMVPLGVDGDLRKWGVDSSRISTFDWWQEQKTSLGEFVFTPSQHFSGRGLTDRDKTLWGSWVITLGGKRIFFSGDSGYFEGFKEIGKRYGPFDLTMIENGAYNVDWRYVHMFPEQSVQAHLDLQGKVMLPIHNGTFDLSFHSWYDPLEKVSVAADKHQVTLSTPVVGEVFAVGEAVSTRWWQQYM